MDTHVSKSQLEFCRYQDCLVVQRNTLCRYKFYRLYHFERNDISEWAHPSGASLHSSCEATIALWSISRNALNPLYESHTDYWILSQIADKLGVKEAYTEGNNRGRLDREVFYASELPNYIKFEDLNARAIMLWAYRKLSANTGIALVR